MKALYIDCTRGFSVDMFVASVLEAIKDSAYDFMHDWQLNLGKIASLSLDYATSYERKGLSFKVNRVDEGDNNGHKHTTLKEVHEFIDSTGFTTKTKLAAKGVYNLLSVAEATVHGGSADNVHFHEVGRKRAIITMLCACDLITYLFATEFVFSHINTGYGITHCEHGVVRVPAPATAELLKKLPQFHTESMKGEMVGPTGAAFIKYFATEFLSPLAFYDRVRMAKQRYKLAKGLGIGAKDIGIANGVISVIVDMPD